MKRPGDDGRVPAFTLVELLVVMAIVGVLASLLLPAAARMTGRARSTACRSNLHQIGIGLRLYLDDHGNRFPIMINRSRGYFRYRRTASRSSWEAGWETAGSCSVPPIAPGFLKRSVRAISGTFCSTASMRTASGCWVSPCPGAGCRCSATRTTSTPWWAPDVRKTICTPTGG